MVAVEALDWAPDWKAVSRGEKRGKEQKDPQILGRFC